MDIRGLIPWNSTELAYSVPIDPNDDLTSWQENKSKVSRDRHYFSPVTRSDEMAFLLELRAIHQYDDGLKLSLSKLIDQLQLQLDI